MGIWYRTGTVALTNGSNRVTGTGTTWLGQATGPVIGNTFWGPDNKPYEVERVVSNTTLDLVEAYSGATVASTPYKINTTEKFSVASLAGQVAATLQYAQAQYSNMSIWAASDLPVDVPVVLPDGVTSKNIPNLAKMSAATAAKLTETPKLKALDVPSSAFGRARLGDADAAAQLTALGASPFGRARLGDADAAAARAALDAAQFGRTKTQQSTTGLDWNGFGGFADSGSNKNQFMALGIDDGNGPGGSSPGSIYGAGLSFCAGPFAAQISISTTGVMSMRTSYAGIPHAWNTVRSSSNTTVDANGFIKNASPVVHLYPDGSFKAEMAEGVSALRVARGVYRVAGSLGFHEEGWYIEGPRDANGRMKFWLDYDQEPDGTINIRTTHREFTDGPLAQRNIVDGLSDGDPVDIPAGREITLRLSIPDDSKRFPDDRL